MDQAKVGQVTAALMAQGVRFVVSPKPDGQTVNWVVEAIAAVKYSADQLNTFEATHGVVARTNRAEFE